MEIEVRPKLSICISTFNRPEFIEETLHSIIPQLSETCEIVVLDSSPSDVTRDVVCGLGEKCRLSYLKNLADKGQDEGFDRAVEIARGEYCWLMPDDDLLKPGAIAAVLEGLKSDLSLLVVNIEYKNFDMTEFVLHKWLTIGSNALYGPCDFDRLCVDVGDLFMYLGSVVIRRDIWLARDKKSYYGTMFMHAAVIMQKQLPGETLVIAEPLITYRGSNAHSYSPKWFQIYMLNWPSVIWSSALSTDAKRRISDPEPWRRSLPLARLRGLGYYTRNEYVRWIKPRLRKSWEAIIPWALARLSGVLVNACLLLCYSIAGRYRRVWIRLLKDSRFYIFKRRAAPLHAARAQ